MYLVNMVTVSVSRVSTLLNSSRHGGIRGRSRHEAFLSWEMSPDPK